MHKTFDHAVIYGGTLYPANTPIEIIEPKVKESKEEVTTSDKRTSRKSGTRNKGNK